MIFENLPTTPTSEELIDQAFSRAARAGRAKSGSQAQQSMLQTASNVLSDNLGNVATEWPDFREIDPFYYELADAIVDVSESHSDGSPDRRSGGVDELRQSLSEIQWASRKTKEIGREYQGKLVGDAETDRKFRKQGFARLADVVEEVADDLALVGEARNALRDVPDIDAHEPTIVVAGYPNVGKSSFVNAVTNAIVFVVDASGYCGYPLDDQLELRDVLAERFGDVPVLTVCNKSDLSIEVDADAYMSVENGENVDEVLDTAVEAVGYEPELPFEDE
jgi:nucleolar GTP-binding protein